MCFLAVVLVLFGSHQKVNKGRCSTCRMDASRFHLTTSGKAPRRNEMWEYTNWKVKRMGGFWKLLFIEFLEVRLSLAVLG